MSGPIRLCRSAFANYFAMPGLRSNFQGIALAGIFGTVRGIVHDAQHRPIEGAKVVLQATQSDWKKEAATDGEDVSDGCVPAGLYTLHILRDGFRDVKSDLTVLPDPPRYFTFRWNWPRYIRVWKSPIAQLVDAGFSTARQH